MIILVMGVSGCGKTTVGRLLAEQLGWEFCDADWHHPPANVEKMRSGIPLAEADRQPWLQTLARLIREWTDAGQSAVLACSALSERSRSILAGPGVSLVYLRGTAAVIGPRLRARHDHFMPSGLLESQFRALEEPKDALTLDVSDPPEEIVARIRAELDPRPAS